MDKVYSMVLRKTIKEDQIFIETECGYLARILGIKGKEITIFKDFGEVEKIDLTYFEKKYTFVGTGVYTRDTFFKRFSEYSEKTLHEENVELQLDICWNALSRIYESLENHATDQSIRQEITDTLERCWDIGMTNRDVFELEAEEAKNEEIGRS